MVDLKDVDRGNFVPPQSSEKQPQESNDELCNLRKSVETLLAREYELVMERDALRKEVKRNLKRHEERVAYLNREVGRKDEEITLLRRADISSEDVQHKLQGMLKAKLAAELKAKLAAEAKLKEVNSALLKSEAHITSLSTALRRKDELLNLSQEEINTRQRMDVEKRAAYEKALNEQRDVISHLQNEVYIKRQQVLSKDHELESLKEQESCSLNKKVRDILLSLAHPCAEITIEEAATILCVPAPYAVALMNTGVIRAYPSRTGRQYVRVHDVVKLQEEYEASKAGSL
jgi:chromosome segregation ATPase